MIFHSIWPDCYCQCHTKRSVSQCLGFFRNNSNDEVSLLVCFTVTRMWLSQSLSNHFSPWLTLIGIIGRSGHKHNFCCNRSMLVRTKVLLRKNYVCILSQQKVCHNKHTFVCCDKSMLVETKQKFCHDKHTFVCCDKSMLVETKLL